MVVLSPLNLLKVTTHNSFQVITKCEYFWHLWLPSLALEISNHWQDPVSNKMTSVLMNTTTTTHVHSYLHKRISNLVVHLLRGMFHAVGPIEGELLGRLFWSFGPQDETLAALRVNGQHRLAPQSLLPVVQGPAPDHHLHCLGAHVSSRVTPRLGEVSRRQLVVVAPRLRGLTRTGPICRLMDVRTKWLTKSNTVGREVPYCNHYGKKNRHDVWTEENCKW